MVQERQTNENPPLVGGDNQGQRGLIEVSRLSAGAQRRAEGGWTAAGARVRTQALIFSIKAAETHGAALRNSFLSAAHQAEPTSVAENIQRERERK